MRRTASSTSRVGWRATAFSAENCFRPPGCMVWWVYCLSFHLLPVRRTFSALITTTKSPQSSCGVKVGLCLPRSTLAMVVAARPSTLSFTSMTTHSRLVVNLLPITVFIARHSRKGWRVLRDHPEAVNTSVVLAKRYTLLANGHPGREGHPRRRL